jgi:hypothetical protein
MYTYTTQFTPVRARREVTGTCPVCGKTSKRSRTFEHTINPFNKNPDGTVKSASQVREAVTAEADAWQPDFTHQKCEARS